MPANRLRRIHPSERIPPKSDPPFGASHAAIVCYRPLPLASPSTLSIGPPRPPPPWLPAPPPAWPPAPPPPWPPPPPAWPPPLAAVAPLLAVASGRTSGVVKTTPSGVGFGVGVIAAYGVPASPLRSWIRINSAKSSCTVLWQWLT